VISAGDDVRDRYIRIAGEAVRERLLRVGLEPVIQFLGDPVP